MELLKKSNKYGDPLQSYVYVVVYAVGGGVRELESLKKKSDIK